MYHVMSRGDQRDDIFLGDADRHDFIRTLAEACQKTGWQAHAFCLMRNHYHLVLETPDANLVSGMAWLQSTYTIRLNNRHRLTGHVLSGRYKAQLVEGSGNGYLRVVCDYVHLNPVRARLLAPEDRLLALVTLFLTSLLSFLPTPASWAKWSARRSWPVREEKMRDHDESLILLRATLQGWNGVPPGVFPGPRCSDRRAERRYPSRLPGERGYRHPIARRSAVGWP